MAETITKISSLEDHQISLPVQEHFTSANGWESMQTYARPNGHVSARPDIHATTVNGIQYYKLMYLILKMVAWAKNN